MNDYKLALRYMKGRPLVTILTVASVALGLALACVVLVVAGQTRSLLEQETESWDIVVGAKGSPLQLVLNSIYYLDAPVGNTNISVWNKLKKDPTVDRIVPVNMGDNYLGSPIVGTTPNFFDGRISMSGGNVLREGKMFARPFETIIGSEVAEKSHIRLGMKLVGAHGWRKSNDFHKQFPYTVVGILARTGTSLDRALFTDYHSTWIVHSHPDADEKESTLGHNPSSEVTALLVHLSQPGRRFMLVQEINHDQSAMAAVPVDEINNLIISFLGPLQKLMLGVSYLVAIVSGLTILISLYLMIYQRRRDIAILRAIGATRADIFRLITIEAALLSGFGVIIGWVLGHGSLTLLSPFIADHFGIAPNGWIISVPEIGIVFSIWILGILAGILPAAVAYRLPVSDILTTE